jgi:hypothetical protein
MRLATPLFGGRRNAVTLGATFGPDTVSLITPKPPDNCPAALWLSAPAGDVVMGCRFAYG